MPAADSLKAFFAAGLRLGLWLGALYCGWQGYYAVFDVAVYDSRLMNLWHVPVDVALPWWALAVMLAICAQDIDLRMAKSAPSGLIASVAHRHRPVSWLLLLAAIPPLIGAFALQADRDFTAEGVAAWALGVTLFCAGLLYGWYRPLVTLRRVANDSLRFVRLHPLAALSLALIIAVATAARFLQLGEIPREIHVDQLETMLDVQGIVEGKRRIFFADNNVRDAFHLYFLAALSPLTNGVNFDLLKLGTALESIVGVLAFYFLGAAFVGDNSWRARTFGLLFALVGAVGLWHLIVTRISLRIMLAPLVVTLLSWSLIRLMRHNRREDAVMAGLLLGFGVYAYQALRYAPVMVLLAVGMAALWIARTRMERRGYYANLLVVAAVSFTLFIPSLRYWASAPDLFWNRAIQTMSNEGVVCFEPNPLDCPQIESPLAQFAGNMVKVLGMFTYRGDSTGIYNAPWYPALDPLSGALFIAGCAAALVWVFQRRDVLAAFLLLSMLLMFVPSAATLAKPNEVPSIIRSAGAMPMIYGLVAFGLLNTMRFVAGLLPRAVHPAVRLIPLAAAPLMFSHAWRVISQPYNDASQYSAFSLHEIGLRLREQADEIGWGNIFYVYTGLEEDVRPLRVEGGLNPGAYTDLVVSLDLLVEMIYSRRMVGITDFDPRRYAVDNRHDMLFVYAADDVQIAEFLREWLPQGREMLVRTRLDKPWLSDSPRMFYIVPPMSDAALVAFLGKFVDVDALARHLAEQEN